VEAQRRAIAGVEFVMEKTRLLDRLRGQLNKRQAKARLRMLREGPKGFQRPKRALARTGELRHAPYWVPIPGTISEDMP
jgi:hypothetical protein